MLKKYWQLGLLISLIITFLSVGFTREVNWGSCARYSPKYTNIHSVDCESLEYGFPYKYIGSQPKIDVLTFAPSKTSPVLLGGTSRLTLKPLSLADDILAWSAVTVALIAAINTLHRHKRVNNSK